MLFTIFLFFVLSATCQQEVRQCLNGVLSGSATAITCNSPCNNCTIRSKVLQHGESGYEQHSPTLTLVTYHFSFLISSFLFHCLLSVSYISIYSNSFLIIYFIHENCRTFFAEGLTACTDCQSQVVACNNGVVNGTYQFEACNKSCAACLAPGGRYVHLQKLCWKFSDIFPVYF